MIVDGQETENKAMRLQASDEDVYRIMDERERYLIGMGVCAAACGILLAILFMISRTWDILYFTLLTFLGACYLLVKGIRCGWRIMEMKQCYLEITETCLVVRQAEKDGKYESCRIFLDEIEKIVEGSRRGIPEFYVIMQEKISKSFFLLGQAEISKAVFLVKSFGYRPEAFQEFYNQVRWEVPGKVRIVGTNTQETWYLKKPHAGILLFGTAVVMYLFLKVAAFLI